MIPFRPVARSGFALMVIAAILLGCDSGPKTYDDCMLLASRNSDNDRQFNSMAKSCKDQFGHTLPFRAPPTEAPTVDAPKAKRP